MAGQAMWVTAQYINQPDRNPKFGSIKTPEMGYISVPAGQLGNFQKGSRYCIEIDTTPKGYHNFVRFANEPPQQQPRQQQRGGVSGYQPAPQARRPQPPVQQARRAPPAPEPSLPFNSNSDPQARTIFITGVVGRAMGSGEFTSLDILVLTQSAAAAWDQVILGIQPKQYTAEEAFDDDIPPATMYDPDSNNTRPEDDEIPY